MDGPSPSLPLRPYRVLDLSDESGHLCGRILADLGAEVIKVEPPGGDPARKLGPFYEDLPDPERSLPWWAYNYNKRSITLDLERPVGRDLFRALVATSDFVIETFPPGYLDGLDIGYASLAARGRHDGETRRPGDQVIRRPGEGARPVAGGRWPVERGSPPPLGEGREEGADPHSRSLVWVAITPFGQTGPRARWRATDLVAMGAGGWSYVMGDADRAPVRVSVPQAYSQAGAQAAIGALIAHHDRVRTGRSHFVDVSLQEAVTDSLIDVQPYWDLTGFIHQRGDRIAYGAVAVRSVWRCADGYVAWRIYVGRGVGRGVRLMVDWLRSEGLGESLAGVDWESYSTLTLPQAEVDAWEAAFAPFFLRYTKRALYEGALARGIMLFPVSDPADIAASEQLEARGFFIPVVHPELGAVVRYPGPPVKTRPAPLGIYRRPPRIGEDNAAIYGGLGLSAAERARLKEEGVV